MPITGSEIKITVRYTYLEQKCENVQYYRPVGAAFLTATMDGVLEAYWNTVKSAFRAIMTDNLPDASWDSILGEEIDGGLSFAEFPIPVLERVGTRATTGLGEPLLSFAAGGFRQTVATRLTRPGQKRFPFLFEADVIRNVLGGAYLALLAAVADFFCTDVPLGVPVLTGVLSPEVVHDPTPSRPTRATQLITGFIINPDVTSQVSRKKGRGI